MILVGGIPTPLQNMSSSVGLCWDDDIPNWMESQKIPWFQTTKHRMIAQSEEKHQKQMVPVSAACVGIGSSPLATGLAYPAFLLGFFVLKEIPIQRSKIT